MTLHIKIDEEKSKHAGLGPCLAQQNGFGPAYLHNWLRLVKGNKVVQLPLRSTKYDLTPAISRR